MNEFQIVSLVALVGALVLVLPGLRGRIGDWPRGFRLAMIWVGIFLIVTLFISVVTGM